MVDLKKKKAMGWKKSEKANLRIRVSAFVKDQMRSHVSL